MHKINLKRKGRIMKKKILNCFITLMMICFVTLGCGGCNGVSGQTLEVQGFIENVEQFTQENYNGEDYLEDLETAKNTAMFHIDKIVLKDKEGKVEKEWKYQDIYKVGGVWTEEKPASASDAEEIMKLSAYEFFVFDGGIVTGFNISQAPGTYICTFHYNTASCDMQYKITAKKSIFDSILNPGNV